MKAKQQMSMRLELVEYGSRLGYPRLPFSLGKRIPQGEEAWRQFATTASILKISPALRNARTLSDYLGDPDAVAMAVAVADDRVTAASDLATRRRAWLAKAREAKAAKKVAAGPKPKRKRKGRPVAKKEVALSQ